MGIKINLNNKFHQKYQFFILYRKLIFFWGEFIYENKIF